MKLDLRNEIVAPAPFAAREEIGRWVIRDGNADLVCTLHGEYAHRHAIALAAVLTRESAYPNIPRASQRQAIP